MLKPIQGGFTIDSADQRILNEQRTITYNVNQNFIQVGAIYLKTSSKNPYEEDWFSKGYRDTNLQDWIDDPDTNLLNVGFNLQFGWVDIDIDAADSEYNRCVVRALEYCGVDTRFRFGRVSTKTPSHVMVQLHPDESQNFDILKRFEPNGFRLKGQPFKIELRSFPTSVDAKNLVREAKQTVMPGSIYVNKNDAQLYDISVWYNLHNEIARSIKDVAGTTPHKTSFHTLIRAIAFGAALYLFKPFWVEGSRQSTASKLGGWLARIVEESKGINEHEALQNSVYCPIDDVEVAESLIKLICEETGDDEAGMRLRIFRDACDKLRRNPDAKIPGWPMMEEVFGGDTMHAIRCVFMPGADVSTLTQMAERYVYDETDDRYIDRDRFRSSIAFVHQGPELERRHRGDFVRIGGKPKPAFRLFEVSSLRKRVAFRDLYPELTPGGILRVNRTGDQVAEDDESRNDVVTVFNVWRGWPLALPVPVDDGLLNTSVTMLDRLLGYITRDNQDQINWLKQWIAWTIQHPGDKQQIAPVIVGGQGVGKSFFGNVFLQSLFGYLWSSASPKILEGGFSVEPFIGRMMVFIDEAKFHSEAATDEIKKLIRNVEIGGAEKFQSARNYHIFARIVFASNRLDMNIGQSNVQDRALFYIKAYDKEHLGLPANKFLEWTVTIKPFFDEFLLLLKRLDVREHFMSYFTNYETDRHFIENTRLSSSYDNDIIVSNMSWARRIAKHIIESGRIYEDADISMPFTHAVFGQRVGEVCKELGMRDVPMQRVLAEFKEAGVIQAHTENGKVFMRFTDKIGSLTDKYGAAISVKMEPQFVFEPSDYGDNDVTTDRPLPWKGLNRRIFSKL